MPPKSDDTLDTLASYAADVKYVGSVEERALIAYERFCLEVAMHKRDHAEAIQNYGCGRHILIQALQRPTERTA